MELRKLKKRTKGKGKYVRVVGKGKFQHLYISAELAKEIDKPWCDVYYSVEDRVVVLKFRDDGDRDSYPVKRASDSSAVTVGCTAIVGVMGLEKGSVSKKVEWRGDELWVWW